MLRAFLKQLRQRNGVKRDELRADSARNWLDEITAASTTPALNALRREIEAAQPPDSRIWQHLARLSAQAGDHVAAETLLQRALYFGGESPELLCDLANIRQLRGDYTSALETYQRALTLDETHELSQLNAALLYLRQADVKAARPLLEKLFARDPHMPGVAESLAQLSLGENDSQSALPYLIAATEASPTNARLFAVLAATYNNLGRREASLGTYQRARSIDATDPLIANNLGLLLFQAGRIDEAIAVLEQAVAQKPDFVEAMNNLANALHQKFLFDRAEKLLQEAIKVRPSYADAHANLSRLYLEQGLTEDAEQHLRSAVTLQPTDHRIQSNLLLCMNYRDDVSRESVYLAHVNWARQLPAPRTPAATQRGDKRRTRMRIGYLSPDFVTHSVAFFIEPILRAHNRDEFDIYCYANNAASDGTTARLRTLDIHWRDISALDDSRAMDCIRNDNLDVLVELAGHMAGNRLTLMRQRPSPIQVTYLGYPNTTGLPEIDYRITDELAESADAQQYYSETLIKLPRCFLSYQPPSVDIALDGPENGTEHCIAFGAFNNLAKVTDETVGAWAAILRAVPGSVLHLPGATVTGDRAKQRWVRRFALHGIAADRIKWAARAPSVEHHLKRYHRVDIALDTYPYNGTTTTMDALWMGVPVVTRYGSCHASRVTYDLLSRVGLGHLAAPTLETYIDTAVQLSKQGPRGIAERRALRQTVQASELLDGKSMAAALEHTYRQMRPRQST